MYAISKKEFVQIIRDQRSLALAIIIPILLLVIFGYGLSLDIDNVPIGLWDQDHSLTSLDFVMHFQGTKYLKIIGSYDNYHIFLFLVLSYQQSKTSLSLSCI